MNSNSGPVAPGESNDRAPLSARKPAPDLLGILNRHRPIRVLNCSVSGCLLESAVPIDVGTIAALTLRIGGADYMDDVRVVRCQPIAGAGSVFHVGAQFLWTTAPGRQSLRLAMQTATGSPHAALNS